MDGQTTRLRADDGVHLTGAGYDVLARALLPVIALYRPASVHVCDDVFDCLALGDSLAIGVGQARPDCYVAADLPGSPPNATCSIFPGMRHVRTAIISLGVNDGDGTSTADNLRRLRGSRFRRISSIGC